MAAASELDVYDVAHLAGGPSRVVEAALATLVASGRVRAAGGVFTTVDASRVHPVEAAVLDAVGTRGHRSLETVHWRLADDDRLLAVARRLTAAGLLAGPAPWRRGASPTRAGRDLLRRLAGDPAAGAPAGDPAALSVALHGPERAPDPMVRAALTERPPAPASTAGRRAGPPPQREVLHGDPTHAAHRTRSALGGAAVLGDGGGSGF